MRISAALEGVHRLYIEAAPLVYYVEANSKYVERMDAVITALAHTTIEAVSSVITLTEVLTLPLRMGQAEYEREYRDILMHSDGFRLLPVTAETAESAARLRAHYQLRTPDALHIASAIESGCHAFLTNDRAIKRVSNVRVLLLDELELDPPDEAPPA